MTTRLPLELQHLCILSTDATRTILHRPNVFAIAARLQSTSPTAGSALSAIVHPPKPPGATKRKRGGLNLGAYPQLLTHTHDPNAYISLSSPPAFTSFQDTPAPGEVSLVKDPPPAQVGPVPEPGQGLKKPERRVLRGVELPERPIPPASDECCMGGCAVCVYDLYSDALEVYHVDLLLARQKLVAAGVPQDLWPDDVRLAGTDGKSAAGKAREAVDDEISRLDVSLKAFLAMERMLKKKRVGASEGTAG